MAKFEADYRQIIDAYEDAHMDSEQEVVKMGLPFTGRPMDSKGDFAPPPTLPYPISDCGVRELQDLMAEFTAWWSYALQQLQLAKGRRDALEEEVKAIRAIVRNGKEGTVADRDNETLIDIRFVDQNARLLTAVEVCDLLTSIVRGFEQSITTISRQLTAISVRSEVEGQSATQVRSPSTRLSPNRNAFISRNRPPKTK